MKTALVPAFVLLSVAVLAGSALASNQVDHQFTDKLNTKSDLTGTFQLVGVGEGSGRSVSLTPGVPVIWANATPIRVDTPFTGSFYANLSLANATGSIKATWGYMLNGHFEPFTSDMKNVSHANRSLISGAPLLPGQLPRTNTTLDTGIARLASATISAAFPAGSYPAIRLTSTAANAVAPTGTNLGATSPSTAAFPTPELPALALTGLGVVVLAGVVLRRRA